MGLGSWWRNLWKKEDAEVIEDAEEQSLLPHERRGHAPEDVEELAMDERTARFAGEATIEDTDRLGDAE
jgi:hypothetical protein